MARALNRLSARTVASLSEPGRYSDGGRLYLSIGKNGRKAWVFFYTRNGRQREMGLGAASDVPLAKARELAAAARIELATGRDPLDAKRATKAMPTFGEMADDVLKVATARSRNEKVVYAWGLALKEKVASLRPIPVDKVTTEDVLAVLKPIWDKTPETASKLRGRIERVLDAAAAKGHRSRENPAAWRGHLQTLLPPRKKLTRGHHAALPFSQVPAFITALRVRPATAARMLEFTILTASRIGEVLGATWAEVDEAAKIWAVPAARMKQGKEHRVPLAPRALKILVEMREQYPDAQPADFIFPGSKEGKPLSNMSASQLFARMGIETTTHGFRSSFRDWAGEMTSFPREIAEQALAHHVGNEVERAYRRGDALEKRRKLMEAWAGYIERSSKAGQ